MKNYTVFNYLASAALVTVVMLLIYATVQQTYRTGLDDPQIQLTRDISTKLQQGRTIESIVTTDSIDISKSLSAFVVLYDANGKAIYSNARLDSKLPQVSKGLFDIVEKNAEHRVTWQPRKAVRMAMVIVKTNVSPGMYVAAGRSMTEVEQRVKQMSTFVLIAWLICLVIIVMTALLNQFVRQRKVN
jgi:hypothetical protein